MTGLADGTRIVVRAGSATAEEVAAVALALDASDRGERGSSPPARPAWQTAARLEGVGGPAMATPGDLSRPRR